MRVLECKNLHLRAGARALLQDISFTVDSGEILGVAGRNGAGKTSLLRVAAGEARGDSGSLRFRGQALATTAPRERARHLAILPQGSSLQFNYSVREVIGLGRIPHGGRDDDAIVDRLIAQCDLDAQADQSYLTLSGGERQRTQLARVLAQLQPDRGADLSGQLLLLDEPTSALDIPHQERFLTLFRTLRERGCAIVLVLHDISLLSRCADRLLLLQGGRTLAIGPARELLTDHQLSALYDYPLHVMPLPQGSGVQVARLPHEHAG